VSPVLLQDMLRLPPPEYGTVDIEKTQMAPAQCKRPQRTAQNIEMGHLQLVERVLETVVSSSDADFFGTTQWSCSYM
jgi:hypothetical protein